MKIELMNEHNVHSVKLIEDECFVHPWSLDSLMAELDKDGSCFLVAEEDDMAIGYVGFNMVLDEGYIANIAVLDSYRRKGVAKALLNRLFQIAQQSDLSFVSLEVRESNLGAIELYKSFGFDTVGKRKNFYRSPKEDALILTKYLKEEHI